MPLEVRLPSKLPLECTPMPTRNVVLTKHQEKLIEKLVGSGRYQNASEVLREGLRLVEQREAENAAKLEILREAARVGFGAFARGEFKEFDGIEDLDSYMNALSEKLSERSRMRIHDRTKMACSPRRCGRARFREHPPVDERKSRSPAISIVPGHDNAGDR